MEFCTDEELAYAGQRHAFATGEPLALGDDYRLAHLPLVAPEHPRAIRSTAGRDYVDGRYKNARPALAAYVPADTLEASPGFRMAEAELRASSFAGKIAWDVCTRRRNVLHASIARPVDAAAQIRMRAAAQTLVARHGFPAIQLGGPFVGSRNHGRIYLPAYPQRIDGGNPYTALQLAAGQAVLPFYAVGLWHLRDDLAPHEASDLDAICRRWLGRETALIAFARLGILSVTDDLALHDPKWDWIDSSDCP